MKLSVNLIFPVSLMNTFCVVTFFVAFAQLRELFTTEVEKVFYVELFNVYRTTFTLLVMLVIFLLLVKMNNTVRLETTDNVNFGQAYFEQFDRQVR